MNERHINHGYLSMVDLLNTTFNHPKYSVTLPALLISCISLYLVVPMAGFAMGKLSGPRGISDRKGYLKFKRRLKVKD